MGFAPSIFGFCSHSDNPLGFCPEEKAQPQHPAFTEAGAKNQIAAAQIATSGATSLDSNDSEYLLLDQPTNGFPSVNRGMPGLNAGTPQVSHRNARGAGVTGGTTTTTTNFSSSGVMASAHAFTGLAIIAILTKHFY